MPLELVDKLSYHDNIVGFKDSQRGEDQLKEALVLLKLRYALVDLPAARITVCSINKTHLLCFFFDTGVFYQFFY